MKSSAGLTRNRCIYGCVVLVLIAIGAYVGPSIPWSEQAPLYEILRTISIMLFGVLGAWFAILFPLLQKKHDEIYADLEKLTERLLPALTQTIYLLTLSLLIPFGALLIKATMPSPPAALISVLRGGSMVLLLLMLAYQVYVFLLVLRPFDMLKVGLELQLGAARTRRDYQQQPYRPDEK